MKKSWNSLRNDIRLIVYRIDRNVPPRHTHARTYIHRNMFTHKQTHTHTHTPTKHTNTHGHIRMHTHTRATLSVHLLSLYLSFLFLSFFLSFILSLSLSLFFALYVCVSFPPSAFLSPLLFLPLRFLL